MSSSKPRFKLFTNVGEFGLFLPLAKSRTRLIISTLVSNAIQFGFTFWVSVHIMDVSTSVGLNMLLITAAMLALLVNSYIEAMVVGDLFFPGRFREKVLLNRRIDIDPNSIEALDESNYRNYNVVFMIVLAALIIGNYFGVSAVTGDYLDEYHELGFHLTQLRSDDAEDKRIAYREFTKPIYRQLWSDPRVVDAMAVQLEAGASDPEMEAWAVWATGEMGIRKHFELLVAKLDSEHPATRAAAAVALGKLNDPRAYPHLEKLLEGSFGDQAMAVAALRGIAMTQAGELAPAVRKFINADNDEVRDYAFWALMQLEDHDSRPIVFERLEEGSPKEKCGALEALKFIGQPDDVQRFKDMFLLLSEDDPLCEEVLWLEPNDDKHRIIWKESHRQKLIKAVWNADGQNHLEWFNRIALDKEMPYPLRAQATDIIQIAKIERRR